MSDLETPKVTTNDLMASVEASIRRYHGLIALTLPFNKASIMDALDQAGIATVVVTFDGYGDSGQIEDVEVDGARATLPDVGIAFKAVDSNASEPKQTTMALREALEDVVYQLLEQEHAGWEDGDGAYGDVTFDATIRTITFDFNERYTASNNTTHSY